MNILVINAGSSSMKYQLYDMREESVVAKGLVDRIGMETSILTHEPRNKPEVHEVMEILDHTAAIRKVLAMLTHEHHGVVASIDEIEAVGHRVVHGGEMFSEAALVTPQVKQAIKQLYELAPLHNPAHMMGIEGVDANLAGIPQVVVFDTAFHQTMPEKHYLYPIPVALYKNHQVRRYGFHGTSFAYVSQRAAEMIGHPLTDLKMVACHIGNGVSVAAIQRGESVDTSMGLTPLEGLMMGTRSGDLDPAIVPFTMAKEDLSIREVNSMLNRHSGLYAISRLSSDMREIEKAIAEGDRNAQLAFDMFEYRLRKYIGAYTASMNGIDVLVFTAGIGENSVRLRKQICDQLTFFGVVLDDAANASAIGREQLISAAHSKVKVLVIPTNEELMIARETYALIAKNQGG